MDYRQQFLFVVIIIMLITALQSSLCTAEESSSSSTSSRVLYESRDAGNQGEEYRLYETYSSSSDSTTSVQNNVKINIDTNVHHSNEDRVLVHQQQQQQNQPPSQLPVSQKGQRQRLNKHGNEIINPESLPVIAINRL